MESAFTPMRHIGFNYLGGLAVGGNRVFYYQRENRAFGNQGFHDFHLLSVSLDAASGYPIVDHGLMVDQDGRTAVRTPGMMTDGQGHVYMIGDWWTIPGDLGTLRYKWNGGNEIYEQLDRGEFFAVAEVDIPRDGGDGLVDHRRRSESGRGEHPVLLHHSGHEQCRHGSNRVAGDGCAAGGCELRIGDVRFRSLQQVRQYRHLQPPRLEPECHGDHHGHRQPSRRGESGQYRQRGGKRIRSDTSNTPRRKSRRPWRP
jgi:hypothetical protein